MADKGAAADAPGAVVAALGDVGRQIGLLDEKVMLVRADLDPGIRASGSVLAALWALPGAANPMAIAPPTTILIVARMNPLPVHPSHRRNR